MGRKFEKRWDTNGDKGNIKRVIDEDRDKNKDGDKDRNEDENKN